MRKAVIILFVVLTFVLGISLVACSSEEATKDGHITIQTITYETSSGAMFWEEESLGIDHFEVNGNRFIRPPYTIYNLPGNQNYSYTIKAYDAEGIVMASASGQWLVVEGFATPVMVSLVVKHQHTFRDTWSSDESYHWHASSCGHAAVGNKEQHTFDGDVCTVCGYDKHVHTYSSSWSSNDYSHWHAATCGHNLTKDNASHTFGPDTVVVEPTCTTNGTGSHRCTICGKEVRYSIPALGHSYDTDPVVVLPSCTESGGTIYTCSVCGTKRTESVPATGHSYDLGVITQPAGCTTEGTKTFTCMNCGNTYTQAIPATGHSYNSGEITTVAGCVTEGTKTFTCITCGDTYTQVIPATGQHTPDNNHLCAGCGRYIGPAGGYIFYDCDADNDTGNADGLVSTEVGWRYLEAAPADLRVVDGVPTVDSNASGYSNASTGYYFGYYRTSDSGSNLYVNGTTTFNAADCTGTAIGTGKTNTQLLMNAMGAETYSSQSGSTKTAKYAAKLCDDLTYTINGVTYDDWFLPSKDELNLMYTQLKANGLGGFANNYYWSSSESYSSSNNAWEQDVNNGYQCVSKRNYSGRVRPIRAF